MWDWSGFYGTHGCLWTFFKGIALIYALMSIVFGEGSAYSWCILISAVIYLLIRILYNRGAKRDYNRKDSYWSKKEDDSEVK